MRFSGNKRRIRLVISIEKKLCNNCGICVAICPRRILRLGEESAEVTDQALCMTCGHCKAVCPKDAPGFTMGNEDFEPLPPKEEALSPSDFLHFIRRRRSIRRYLEKPVENEKLVTIVQAGRYSPTGGNRQACEFTVISGRKTLDEVCTLVIRKLLSEARVIREAFNRQERLREPVPEEYISKKVLPAVWERIGRAWEEGQDQLLYHAPSLILIHVNEGSATTGVIDAGIASLNMLHMAETLGLGGCYIAFLVWAVQGSKDLQAFLKIPPGNRLHIAFTVGYPRVKYLRLVARRPAKITWLGES
jgi:nitroreductase/NAD-dependent dihydropyrimidine dehydrogenase PreA subunit